MFCLVFFFPCDCQFNFIFQKVFSCSVPECTSQPAQLPEDGRFSLWAVPLLPAVALAFPNLFAEQSNVSKSLCFMSCIIISVWVWDGNTSVRKRWTGLIWCHFSLLAAAVGQTTAFTAVVCMMRSMRWCGRTKRDHGKPSFSSSLALCNGSLFLFMGIQMEKVA